jgi:RHS repeat-associated protein
MDNELKGEGNSVNYRYRMHDPRVGRFFAVDPLFKKYPFYSPYAFSGNNVIMSIELEGSEPKSVINEEGKLTSPMVGLLHGAFLFDKTRLQNTTWISSKDPDISWAQKFHFYTVTGEPNATVFYKSVIYDDNLKSETDEYWIGLVGHEQSHQNDMVYDGDNWFYIRYGVGGMKNEYRQIPTEKKAFNIEEKYIPLLLEYNNGKVLDLLSSDLPEDEKSKQMEITGLKFRRDVVLQDRVDKAEILIKNAEKSIDYYKSQNLNKRNKNYDYYEKMIRTLETSKSIQENNVRKAKSQQYDANKRIKKLEDE